VREFARATSFRAAGYRAAADEIIHIRATVAEVRATRRQLTIPVVVVTAGRGTDAVWRDLQRDQVSLSSRGCQTIAEGAGHVVALEEPEAVVNAIRATVDAARGRTDLPLCASTLERAR
jgi:pimeloyl-ACP methyl ester carboxylesterase